MRGATKEVVGFEALATARAVAAEGEPALALANLQDDDHLVVVRPGDLPFEVGVVAGANDGAPGAQGRVDSE